MKIGIDLGGSKTEGILLDESGKEIARQRIPTPKNDYQATLHAIQEVITCLKTHTDEPATIGVGMPGAVSPATGMVKNANSTWLNHTQFHQDLAHLLQCQVRIQNDANCLAVSEAADGAAAGAEVVFAAVLGTGSGGGIAIQGKPLTGHQAIGGEWGHNPLPWASPQEIPGPPCYCGKHGCIETFTSGTGLEKDFFQRTQQQLSAKQICQQIAHNPQAAQACQDYTHRLARSLASVINLLDPQVVVLGGGMSNHQPLYQQLPQLLGQFVFSDTCTTPILPAKHGDSSGVRGAAWLW